MMRFLAWLFLAATVVALGYDVWDFFATGDRTLIALGQIWFSIDVESLNVSQAVVQRYIHPALWNDVIRPVLLAPAALDFAIAALVFFLLSRLRRRRRRIF